VARHGLEERIAVVESDLFASLPGAYDLILCNPPYVTDASMAALPAEYRAEPALALAGGADGMDLIRRIVAEAPAHMNEDAVIVIEVGHERRRFEAAFARLECAWLETSGGDDRVVLVERAALLR
jgi:ribosomal protein L3 glutamine methyltransferase